MSRDYIHQRIEIRKKSITGSFSSSAIVIADTYGLEVRQGMGQRKDSFHFKMNSPINNIFETYYNGDNSTTAFTLKFGPVDSEFATGGNQKVRAWHDLQFRTLGRVSIENPMQPVPKVNHPVRNVN